MKRDITRDDIRELVRRGLAATSGNYGALLKLFGMDESEYKRFLNFLATHDCRVDYRVFRRRGCADSVVALSATPATGAPGRKPILGGEVMARPFLKPLLHFIRHALVAGMLAARSRPRQARRH